MVFLFCFVIFFLGYWSFDDLCMAHITFLELSYFFVTLFIAYGSICYCVSFCLVETGAFAHKCGASTIKINARCSFTTNEGINL
jgi:hypothetical protein